MDEVVAVTDACTVCVGCVYAERVRVRAGHKCVCGTRCSGNAVDVLGMSVVCGMKGVGRVCEMCMYLARGGVGVEGVSGKENCVWDLAILWECVCVWVGVVWLE